MITAKIPAAVGESSPILWRISPPDAEPVSVAAVVVHVHGDGTLAVSARHGGVLFNDDNVSRDDVELIISTRTGAAHLAWWLLAPEQARGFARMAQAIDATGWTFDGRLQILNMAARGEAVGETALGHMWDYAHHIAGVSS